MPSSNLLRTPFLGFVIGLAACSTTSVVPETSGSASAKLTGTVTYRERIALPPSAVITVQLVDISRVDAPALVLGEQLIDTAGKQVPFSFAIAYEPTGIDERMSYAVQARIEAGGRLLFISDQRHAVITRDAPNHVDMVLRSVNTPAR